MNLGTVRCLVLLSLTMVFTISCATTKLTVDEIAQGDYSQHPTDFQNKIVNFMYSYLKDPDSARYEFGEPKKAVISINSKNYNGPAKLFCYAVVYKVNAKNSYGGYAGSKMYIAIFKNDEIFDAGGPTDPEIMSLGVPSLRFGGTFGFLYIEGSE